jgi:hypothetical protein
MRRTQQYSLICLIILALSACARPQTAPPAIDAKLQRQEVNKERELAVIEQFQQQKRVYGVSGQLLMGAVPFCGAKIHRIMGFTAANRQAFPVAFRIAVGRAKHFDDRIMVADVMPGSPAERAGLQEGDFLLGVGDYNTARGEGATKDLVTHVAQILAANPAQVTARLQRGDAVFTAAIAPVLACDYPVAIVPGESINAFATGKAVFVYQGMVRFAQTDEELATVIGHELAHNVRGHIDAKMQNYYAGYFAGMVFDILLGGIGVNTGGNVAASAGNAGAQAFSADFEAEADYVGLYIMASSGLPIEGAANFWRRMGATNPQAISLRSSHPPTAARYLALEATAREIAAKRAAGQPLQPSLQPGATH